MDRNTITGLLLIALLIVGWAYFFAPKADPAAKQQQTTTAQIPDSTTVRITTAPTADTLKPASAPGADSTQLADKFGRFAPVAAGADQVIKFNTDLLTGEVHTQGGQLKPVYLTQHQDFEGQPVPILPGNEHTFFSILLSHNNRVIDSRDLYYTPSTTEAISLKGEATKTLRLRATLAPGKFLEHVYTFYGDQYQVGYQLKLVGLQEVLRDNFVYMQTGMGVPWTEKNVSEQNNKSTVYYYFDESVENLSFSADEVEEEKGILSTEWVSFKSMFFQVALLPKAPFKDVSVAAYPEAFETIPAPGQPLRRFSATARLDYANPAADSISMALYLGPNDRSLLKDYAPGLKETVDMGWGPVGWINKGIILPVFNILRDFTSNYGLIIFLLAVLIKIILSPLTYKSYLSNAKTQVVNNLPEVKELDEKYKNDPTKLQQAKLVFYQSAGVNPLAGCIPLVLQMPVFFAMFTFFPKAIALRHEAFWWADDLSSYDVLVNFGFNVPILGAHLSGFALLMTISQLAYTYVSQRGQTMTGPAAQMKYLGYIFPVVFFFVLNSYSAGLSWYYLVINVLTIAQTLFIKATINEEKIKAKIHETRERKGKAGAPKAGGLAGWLEKQQKRQELATRERREAQYGPQKKGPAKKR